MANYKLKTEVTEHVAGMEVGGTSSNLGSALNAYTGTPTAVYVADNADGNGTAYIIDADNANVHGEAEGDFWVYCETDEGKHYDVPYCHVAKLVLNAPTIPEDAQDIGIKPYSVFYTMWSLG